MNALNHEMLLLNGETQHLKQYLGKVVLIVNTASKCGFTPQYQGLEDLYKTYQDKGFVVLGFPCNQFGGQEPGDNSDIGEFCQANYGVSFPMFGKIDVNGQNAAPLYQQLKQEAPGLFGTEAIKWNFTKFLVNQQGEVVKRFAPTDKPESLTIDIENLLNH
jgi:glutathione peroxidase